MTAGERVLVSALPVGREGQGSLKFEPVWFEADQVVLPQKQSDKNKVVRLWMLNSGMVNALRA